MAGDYIIQQPFNVHLENLKQTSRLKDKCDAALIDKDILQYANSLETFEISCNQFLTDKQIEGRVNPLKAEIRKYPIETDGEDYIVYNAILWLKLKELHRELVLLLKVNGVTFLNQNTGNKGIEGQRAKMGLPNGT